MLISCQVMLDKYRQAVRKKTMKTHKGWWIHTWSPWFENFCQCLDFCIRSTKLPGFIMEKCDILHNRLVLNFTSH